MINRTLVVGDIHGGFKALRQCFERANFVHNKDKLICLGDVCDGWPGTKQCFDELLKVKNLVYILGNHDAWALEWMLYEKQENIWTSQGGMATQESYGFDHENVPTKHIELLNNKAKFYYIDDRNRVFVHGGFDPRFPVEHEIKSNLLWDRELLHEAYEREHYADYHGKSRQLTKYIDIFIGHTSTYFYKEKEPTHYCEVWNLDTGGGWEGKLTIMDVDTKEYWQSDVVETLYPKYRGR